MSKIIVSLALVFFASPVFASQTYFSCSMPISGGYALENQEFAIVINTQENSVTVLGGSSDAIYPAQEIETTNVQVTAGGPNGWPKAVTSEYVSTATGSIEKFVAVFKVGKRGRPAITYKSSEDNQTFELQCF